MKRKHLFLAVTALAAAGGLWLASAKWRVPAVHESSMDGGAQTPGGGANSGEVLYRPARHQPPNPNRKFEKLTPEERVKLARKGPIGG